MISGTMEKRLTATGEVKLFFNSQNKVLKLSYLSLIQYCFCFSTA